jgi:hypothetical protein
MITIKDANDLKAYLRTEFRTGSRFKVGGEFLPALVHSSALVGEVVSTSRTKEWVGFEAHLKFMGVRIATVRAGYDDQRPNEVRAKVL